MNNIVLIIITQSDNVGIHIRRLREHNTPHSQMRCVAAIAKHSMNGTRERTERNYREKEKNAKRLLTFIFE